MGTKKRREIYTSINGPDMTGFGSRNGRNIAMDTMTTKRFAEKLQKEFRVQRKFLRAQSAGSHRTSPTKKRLVRPKSSLPRVPAASEGTEASKEILLFDRTHAADDEQLKWKPKKGKDRRYGSTKPASTFYGAHVKDAPMKASKYFRVNKCKEFYNSGSLDESTLGGGNNYYLNM